ncbi:MAG: hypothetical protein KDD50_13750 [Bdellovibrionales bacterium]|nr:hypothetical protein [Bdellovibrionales bacterium]
MIFDSNKEEHYRKALKNFLDYPSIEDMISKKIEKNFSEDFLEEVVADIPEHTSIDAFMKENDIDPENETLLLLLHQLLDEELLAMMSAVKSERLVSFLYQLCRDHIPMGTVEEIYRDVMDETYGDIYFENEELRDYCRRITNSLLND